MAERLRKSGPDWDFVCATPPREIFAVSEQMIGTPPYRFEQIDADSARIVEVQRKGFFGNWTTRVRRPHWVRVRATVGETGTDVVVESSTGGAAQSRALQIVNLLTRGAGDYRTVYRDRRIPRGPVSLVASWASTPYLCYAEPSFSAPRTGPAIRTATPVIAVANQGSFVKVETESGETGWVDRDQIVPAPVEATREAQDRTARAVV